MTWVHPDSAFSASLGLMPITFGGKTHVSGVGDGVGVGVGVPLGVGVGVGRRSSEP